MAVNRPCIQDDLNGGAILTLVRLLARQAARECLAVSSRSRIPSPTEKNPSIPGQGDPAHDDE